MPPIIPAQTLAREALAAQVLARFGGNPLDPDTKAVRDMWSAILGSLSPAPSPAEIDATTQRAMAVLRREWNALAGTVLLASPASESVGPFVPTDFSDLGGTMIATGTYVGDGTDNRLIVTGLSGAIRAVHIEGFQPDDPFTVYSHWSTRKDDTMIAKQAVFQSNGSSADVIDEIAFVGANFTVDALNMNLPAAPGVGASTYHWTAWS